MHRFHTFKRIVRNGATNLFRNSWLTIAATAVMIVALIIISLAIVLNVTANNAIEQLSKNLKVSVYLNDDVSEEERQALESALADNPSTASVDYVDKVEAQAKFNESFRDDPQLQEGLSLVGSDTLPASLEVSVTDLSKMTEIEKVAKEDRFKEMVESITLGKTDTRKTIDKAVSLQKFINMSSIVAATAFTIISALIIFNTIRMAIFTRSEEIRIMKLIGATPNYIRGPFLVEASLYGAVAGIVANSVIYSFIFSVGSKVSTQPEITETYNFFTEPSVMIAFLLGSVFAGVLIGIVSSSLAMEKYLKLKHW